MSEDTPERRTEDRRTGQGGYDGPERRIGNRRVPTESPAVSPPPDALSDINLLRAYQRAGGGPEADALLAEIERRGLGV